MLNTLMGTPTTRSLRAKTGSLNDNYRVWNKFQTVFLLLYNTTSKLHFDVVLYNSKKFGLGEPEVLTSKKFWFRGTRGANKYYLEYHH